MIGEHVFLPPYMAQNSKKNNIYPYMAVKIWGILVEKSSKHIKTLANFGKFYRQLFIKNIRTLHFLYNIFITLFIWIMPAGVLQTFLSPYIFSSIHISFLHHVNAILAQAEYALSMKKLENISVRDLLK
jgi:hypothetical protein